MMMLETRKKTYSRRSVIAAKPTTTAARTTTRTEDDDDDVNVVSETMRKRRGRRTHEEEDSRDALPLPSGKKHKKREEEEKTKKETKGKKRVVLALFLLYSSVGMILVISYLRLLIVPDAVRTKAMEHAEFLFPSWMGSERDVLEPPPGAESRRFELRFVLQRDGTFNRGEASFGYVERQTETSGGYRAGVRKHRVGAVEIKAVHSEKDAV